jgi:trehalose 6-phosphate synthase
MVVTPLRDGMNLVAKEFVAARTDDSGVLVLSEFTGAADELDQALIVNPHDIDGLKATMERATSMPKAEQKARMAALRKVVEEHDVKRWATSFINTSKPPVSARRR